MQSEFSIYSNRALHGACPFDLSLGAPTSDNSYGSPGEESQRLFRTIRGTKGDTRAPGVHKGTPKSPKRNS